MQRLAGVLNIEIDADLLEQLVIAAGFESMKDKASQYVPASGMQVWKSEKQFFNRGDAYLRSELKQEDLEIYDKAISQLIGKDDIEWLEQGLTIWIDFLQAGKPLNSKYTIVFEQTFWDSYGKEKRSR